MHCVCVGVCVGVCMCVCAGQERVQLTAAPCLRGSDKIPGFSLCDRPAHQQLSQQAQHQCLNITITHHQCPNITTHTTQSATITHNQGYTPPSQPPTYTTHHPLTHKPPTHDPANNNHQLYHTRT